MRTQQRYLIIVLLQLATWGKVTWCQEFKAEIHVSPIQVKLDTPFLVDTAIRNIDKDQQTIEICPCTYPSQWVADNQSIRVHDFACLQSTLKRITLKPGQAYKNSFLVEALSSKTGPTRDITFRLGYGTKAARGEWKPWPTIPPIWSNAVTVVVDR